MGKEIGKYRPALVLSSKAYNHQTGLLICCPVSSSVRGGATEVTVNNLDQPSVVAANLIQTLSWKHRKARKITQAEESVLENVILRIIPLIGADEVIEKLLNAES
ncbi:MAG: MazF family transcriptional regulator [Gammaproteobacteria bacterium]|nr:MazF family transcriptional regulator [Gammaproteobacteria bacterium]